MPQRPPYEAVDVAEFKSRMCEYMRRLQAGEVDLVIRRYRKPVAIVLSTKQTDLRNAARTAQAGLNACLNALERHATQRRRILITATLSWPLEKSALLRAPDPR